MLVTEAVELVERTTFIPDWEITASEDIQFNWTTFQTVSRPGSIVLHVSWEAPDYDEEYAPDYYKPTNPGRVFRIKVTDKTETEVLRAVLDVLVRCQTHEAREAFRVWQDGRWVAPFHPHRPEGQDLYGDAAKDVEYENAFS